jgi:hypothetical protein
MLQKKDRVMIYGRAGTIIEFIPRRMYEGTLDAVVETDTEMSFDGVRGKILIMQLTIGDEWGADHDVLRTVALFLCPSLGSWLQSTEYVQVNSHLVYEVL